MNDMNWIRGVFGALVLAVVFALGGMVPVSPAFAQQIVVEGGSGIDPAALKPYFSGTDPASIQRGVDDLKATGIYSSVSARAVDGRIVVSLAVAKQVINRVAFEGNSKITKDQLEVEVQSKPGQPYSEAVGEGDVGRIKDAYKKYGRNEARVTKRLVTLPNGRVDLVFSIDEGDKTGIREINFVGNNAISSYRLHNLMQTSTMNLLSWFKSTDVYDPDRLASDEEAIRRYYMKNGFADFRIVNTDVTYQPNPAGYVITITVDEGPQYHVSGVSVDSHIPAVDGPALLSRSALHAGDVYDAGGVDKTVDQMTRAVATQGYAFSEVRPHGERDTVNHTIALNYSVDNGPKVYIERIDIVGNTRTRDYVIRREFDIGEGDPYNHVMIERAERRLNGLGYFKKVHISNRPGSTPDRVIVVVEVQDQPTGSLSLSGGYSTTQGIMAELAYTETNFLGRGQYVRLSVSDGQYSQGWKASFTEPYFLGQRLAAGFDLYHQVNSQNQYALYENWTTGATLRLGVPITDELTFQPNYALYQSKISIPNTTSQPYDDCSGPNSPWYVGGTYYAVTPTIYINCLTNGEAPVEIKQAAAQGAVTTSLIGFTMSYNTLDDRRDPTSGWAANYKQDFAGVGGQSDFIRETLDARWFHPVVTDDFIGQIHLQAGQINGFGSKQLDIINNFMMGPTLVRGFAPGGIGPRDVASSNNITGSAIGGTTYYGASAEVDFPIFGLPKEIGLKGALFADAGNLIGYSGQTNFASFLGYTYCPAQNVILITQPSCAKIWDPNLIRSSVGASLIWNSPMGPIRFDFALPLSKGKYDQTQVFNFSGGATF
ncbi:Beta-barrel assembly machine subunit BamA [Roseiarcus fermentans]|uniref:Outer membrane protein assembly factor BamA n=1 Tax=Roseiarcus fermentans TaxID=1473586 RepID=A0A366F4Z0_9HYPH|nr:outer membrane protein assembly factor BamA [Roseiarcus fermentans]RBP09711.1 Beta-barrel assembly machine subunit BamA [Roseiarcus fermentans]